MKSKERWRKKSSLQSCCKEVAHTVYVSLLAGESGKSTVLKQMRLSHGNGFDNEYRLLQGKKILLSLLKGVVLLLENFDNEESIYSKLSGELNAILNSDARLTVKFAKMLSDLAKDKEFRKIYDLNKDLMTQNFLSYLSKLSEFPNWGGPKWLPSTEEILCGRSRTVGVNKSMFRSNKRLFEVIDVGGQRNQRQKYIHLFDNIDQIIYVASLSDYNMKLWESPTEDRLKDSIKLFVSKTNNFTSLGTSLYSATVVKSFNCAFSK